jgi:hypothetical protein
VRHLEEDHRRRLLEALLRHHDVHDCALQPAALELTGSSRQLVLGVRRPALLQQRGVDLRMWERMGERMSGE